MMMSQTERTQRRQYEPNLIASQNKNATGSIDTFGGHGGISAKKRQPTSMPYNLPGDEVDYNEKNDNIRVK